MLRRKKNKRPRELKPEERNSQFHCQNKNDDIRKKAKNNPESIKIMKQVCEEASLMVHIFSFLPVRDICSHTSLVSPLWHSFSSHSLVS